MRKDKFKRQGNIVHTMHLGNTTIYFCDDYVVQTPEKVEKVLDDMHAAGWAIIESLNREDGESWKNRSQPYM